MASAATDRRSRIWTPSNLPRLEGQWLTDATQELVAPIESGDPFQRRGTAGTVPRAIYGIPFGGPRAGVLHQNRLVLIGGSAIPDAVVASKTGEWTNFIRTERVGDEDVATPASGFWFQQSSELNNPLCALIAQEGVFLFGEDGEASVPAGPFTAADVEIRSNSRFGVDPGAAPTLVSNLVAFLQRGGHDLRGIAWQEERRKYEAISLREIAGNVFRRAVGMASRTSREDLADSLQVVDFEGDVGVLTLRNLVPQLAWTKWEMSSEGRVANDDPREELRGDRINRAQCRSVVSVGGEYAYLMERRGFLGLETTRRIRHPSKPFEYEWNTPLLDVLSMVPPWNGEIDGANRNGLPFGPDGIGKFSETSLWIRTIGPSLDAITYEPVELPTEFEIGGQRHGVFGGPTHVRLVQRLSDVAEDDDKGERGQPELPATHQIQWGWKVDRETSLEGLGTNTVDGKSTDPRDPLNSGTTVAKDGIVWGLTAMGQIHLPLEDIDRPFGSFPPARRTELIYGSPYDATIETMPFVARTETGARLSVLKSRVFGLVCVYAPDSSEPENVLVSDRPRSVTREPRVRTPGELGVARRYGSTAGWRRRSTVRLRFSRNCQIESLNYRASG